MGGDTRRLGGSTGDVQFFPVYVIQLYNEVFPRSLYKTSINRIDSMLMVDDNTND